MSATYTVVTLDGQEHANLDAETVKEWFLKKKLREDSFVMSSESGEWKLLKKVFDVSLWFAQNFGHAQYPPQMPQQAVYQQQAYPQQMQQQVYPQQMPPQSIYEQHAQQHNYYPAQPEVNTNWQQQQYQQPQFQQQQYQPQQQWVSQQNWVAPPPPVQSFAQRIAGVFESATGRAKAATISLKVCMALSGVIALFNLLLIISPPNTQQAAPNPSILMLAGAMILSGVLYIAAFIVTIVLFLMWLHRAYKNLHAFGMATETSPGWVVGYWFIPIINLFRPYQRVNELVEKTVTIATQFRCNASILNPSSVGAWWACYLGSGIIGNFANRKSFRAATSEDFVFAAGLDLVSCILLIVAGWLIITIIQGVDEMHESCVASVSRNPFMQ